MSFMIDDILGNNTKKKLKSEPTSKTKLKCNNVAISDESQTVLPTIKYPQNPQESLALTTETSSILPERTVIKGRLSVSPTPSTCSSERSVSPTDSEGEPRRKKARTSFTNEQIQLLERIYTSQRYLASHNRTDIARMLNLSETQIKTWFQNRRMKEKRQIKGIEDRLGGTIPTPPPTLPTGLPVLGYPSNYLGYSPGSSPAPSPTAIPAIDNAGIPISHCIPAEPLSRGMFGHISNPMTLPVGPTSPHMGSPFPGPYTGSSLGAYPVSMVPSPFGHALMGAAIL